MNSAHIKGACVFVPVNNKELLNTVVRLLESSKQTDSDLKIDVKEEWLFFQKETDKSTTSYVFDTHETDKRGSSSSGTIIEKNTMNKFHVSKQKATLSTSPPLSRPSTPPPEINTNSSLPETSNDAIMFQRHKSQIFVVSKDLENIMIGDFMAHDKGYHYQVTKLKKDLIDMYKKQEKEAQKSSSSSPQKSNVENVLSSPKPMEIRIPSRLCIPKTRSKIPSGSSPSSSYIPKPPAKKERPRSVNLSNVLEHTTFSVSQKPSRKTVTPLQLSKIVPHEPKKENQKSVSPRETVITSIRLKDVVYIDNFTSQYLLNRGSGIWDHPKRKRSTSVMSTPSSFTSSTSSSSISKYEKDPKDYSESSTCSTSTSVSSGSSSTTSPRKGLFKGRVGGHDFVHLSDVPYYNFLPLFEKNLCRKTKHLLSISCEEWRSIKRKVSENSLCLYDAMHYGLVAPESILSTKLDYSTKHVVINITIPVMQFNYTYKVVMDMYSMVLPLENTDYLFFYQFCEMPKKGTNTKIGEPVMETKNRKTDEDSGSTSEGDSDDVEEISKKGREKLELTRPKKPLCYVVLLDLTSDMDSSTVLSNLCGQILNWIGMDTVPKEFQEDIFCENGDLGQTPRSSTTMTTTKMTQTSPNDRVKEKNFLRFIKKNFFLKNCTFVVILGHSPQSLVLKQIETQIKSKGVSTPRSTSHQLEEIDLGSPHRTTPITVIPKNGPKLPEKMTYGDETDKLLKIVEKNTATALKITKKIFGNSFHFMNIDCENAIQVNTLFQKIATLAMNQNVFDSAKDVSIHAIPNTSSFVNSKDEVTLINGTPGTISGTKNDMDGWQVAQQHYLSTVVDLFKKQ